MRIAIIASMKNGLEHFVYREMCDLAARGVSLDIYPTKYQYGLYNPRPEWNTHRWHIAIVLLSQLWRFLCQPRLYVQLLVDSFRRGAVVDFLLAAYFAPKIRGADVIYSTFGDRKLFIGYYAKRLVNRPLVVTIHAYELYRNPNPQLFVQALRASDRILAVTEHNRDVLHSRYDIPPERVTVSRLSVDLDEYCPAKNFVVLIVAHFVEKKGHEILLKAVQRMGRSDVEVWVVGGPINSVAHVDVPAIVERLGLQPQVAFFGKLSGAALKAVYHACDVFCLPSRVDRFGDSEGFPTAIIEAMACGKPVITTRHVEIPRIVDQIVVDENDVGALAEALEHLYASPARRDVLGARNRELAEVYFTGRNMDERLGLFEQLARTGRDRQETGRSAPTAHADRAPRVTEKQRF